MNVEFQWILWSLAIVSLFYPAGMISQMYYERKERQRIKRIMHQYGDRS